MNIEWHWNVNQWPPSYWVSGCGGFFCIDISSCYHNLAALMLIFTFLSTVVKYMLVDVLWFLTNWSREMLNGVSLLVKSCFKDRIGRGFYIALWSAAKNGYYELLKPSETITGDRYRTQLMHLSWALKEKRPLYQERHNKVILWHDNARPHLVRLVKTYLKKTAESNLHI